MMPLSVKACLTMLWGISVLFPLETTGASIPETSSNSTEPNKASGLPTVPPDDDTKSATWGPTHTPTDVAVDSRGSNGSIHGLVVMSTATTGSLGDHTPTTGGDSQLSKNTTTPPTPTPPEHPIQQQSSTASTVMTDPPTAPTATSPRPTFRAKLDITTTLFFPDDATENASHITSGPSASTPTMEIASSTSELPPMTSVLVTKTETSTASTKLLSTSETGSNISISQFPGTKSLSSTTVSPTSTGSNDFNLSTTTNITGLFVPHVPKRLPVPKASSTPATTAAPNKVSRSPPSSEVPPCSTRALVKQSLIAIASLGGLATIFMVSTIVLCAKLSARRHKVKKPQQATEMMCISALLPERDFSYTRQRNPISNGVLVIHTPGDSDEDGGDNLTLSSFLPENDRFL